MGTRAIRKLAAVAACAALGVAAALPSTGVADQGGVPHTTKPCKPRKHANGPKHPARNAHGRKCGFNRPAPEPPPEPEPEPEPET